jgi:hypothetical protein
MSDMQLVTKGRSEPIKGLLQQARVHLELATMHATPLAENGWSVEDTNALRATLTKLDTDAAMRADAFEASNGHRNAEQVAIDQVKAFVRRLRNALPRALRESPEAGITEDAFRAGGTLRRSTPKLSKYLLTIRPSVVRLDAALAPHFNGTLPSTILDSVKAALDSADARQENALAALPAETQNIYESKGRLLQMIEDLNRAGKNAFDGNATMAAMFNKDILLRARTGRKPSTDVEPVPAAT